VSSFSEVYYITVCYIILLYVILYCIIVYCIILYHISPRQGSRLTAFEIVEEKMPGTLVCDSMAAALMRKRPYAMLTTRLPVLPKAWSVVARDETRPDQAESDQTRLD